MYLTTVKNNIFLGVLVLLVLFSTQITKAQEVFLPYYTGFDTEEEQAGWKEYKTADSCLLVHWTIAEVGYSNPHSITHSYAPSTDVTIGDNWFVSPGFSIGNGGMLDSIRYKFSGYSKPGAGDTIAIYLLNGSQNPSIATSKILLFDFRGDEYINDYKYHVKTGISLPAIDGTSYLAIRYRNDDWDSNWLTVGFDNISVSSIINIKETRGNKEIKIFPNPSSGIFTVQSPQKIQSIKVSDNGGKIIYQSSIVRNNITKINLSDYPKGIYVVNITQKNKVITEKIVIQ